MADVTLVEGSLSFLFKDINVAEKYDDWSHYRNQYVSACGGSKAVDFLVVQGSSVWLIEVKDFRLHKRTKAIELTDEIARKVQDTLSGLVSARFLATDERELKSSHMALNCKKVRVGFHLEQPSQPSRLFPLSVDPANIKMKLKQVLRFIDPHPEVFDRRSFPKSLGVVSSV